MGKETMTATLIDFLKNAIEDNTELEIAMIAGNATISFRSTISDFDNGVDNIIVYAHDVIVNIPTSNIKYNDDLEEFTCYCQQSTNIIISIPD